MADSQRKTANLLNPSDILYNMQFDTASNPPAFVPSDTLNCSNYIPVTVGTYLRTLNNVAVGNWFYEFDANKNYLRTKAPGAGAPMEISVDASYIAFNISNTTDINNYMFARTSTPIPYEPYGWQHSLRKLGTDTDTLTTLPADIYADGTNATVGLQGNMSQSGTPTPSSPIQPQETGERTGNLLFKKIPNANINSDGKISEYSSGYEFALYVAEVEEGKTYTTGVSFSQVYALYTSEPDVGSVSYNGARSVISTSVQNITIPTGNNIKYIVLRWASTVEQTMFNEGTTALPYEPYGYKIPISSANTTTPVYLGEVESTRRIKKLVLTGEGKWYKSGAYKGSFYLSDVLPAPISLEEQAYCSHAEFTSISNYAQNKFCFNGKPINLNLWIGESSWTTDDFKAYLAQQYAAGTPVTIWYVLATEETGMVNEPIRKIGDYADEVNGISIPTTVGANSFDVLTTLKPSEVELTYTGWHDASVGEWDGSDWQ